MSNYSLYDMTYLGNVKLQSFLEVFRLGDNEQVEAPATAEVSHDNGVNRPGC